MQTLDLENKLLKGRRDDLGKHLYLNKSLNKGYPTLHANGLRGTKPLF